MIRLALIAALVLPISALAQPQRAGPLGIQNALGEIASNGTQATARANLGLGLMATQSPAAVAITGGSIAGLSSLGVTGNGTIGGTLGVTGALSVSTGFAYSAPSLAVSYIGNYTNSIVSPVLVSGGVGGTLTTGSPASVFSFLINSDQVNASAVTGMNGFFLGHNMGGGTLKGGRTSLYVFSQVTGASADGPSANSFFVGIGNSITAAANLGGTAGAAAGAVQGMNPRAVLYSGATYLQSVAGMELDVGARAGSIVQRRSGLVIVLDQLDNPAGLLPNQNAAISIAYNSSAGSMITPGFDHGLSFGDAIGWWPMVSTATLVGAIAPLAGGAPYAASYGIDFSNVAFSTAFLKSTGFLVDGTGTISAVAYKTGATAGVTCASVTAATVTVANGIVTHC